MLIPNINQFITEYITFLSNRTTATEHNLILFIKENKQRILGDLFIRVMKYREFINIYVNIQNGTI